MSMGVIFKRERNLRCHMVKAAPVVVVLFLLSGCVDEGGPTDSSAPSDPIVEISTPFNNETVIPPFFINGTAGVEGGEIIVVQIRERGGGWQNLNGGGNWSYLVEGLDVGNHTFEARSLADGDRWSQPANVSFAVAEPPPPPVIDQGHDVHGVTVEAQWLSNETLENALNISIGAYGGGTRDRLVFDGTADISIERTLPSSPCGDGLTETIETSRLFLEYRNFTNGSVNTTLEGPFDAQLSHAIDVDVEVNKTGRSYRGSYGIGGTDDFVWDLYDEGAFLTETWAVHEWDPQRKRLNVEVGSYNDSPNRPCRFSGTWDFTLHINQGTHWEEVTDGSMDLDHNEQTSNNAPHSVGPGWGGGFYEEERWYSLVGDLTIDATGDVYSFQRSFYTSTY